MRARRLIDKNIEHLRKFYTTELTETQKFVIQVRSVLARLKPSEYPLVKPARPSKQEVNQPTKKRGRKPAVQAEPAKKRGRPPKATMIKAAVTQQSPPLSEAINYKMAKMETTPKVTARKNISKVEPAMQVAAAEPKPKRRRIRNSDHRGKVLLASWKNPLK